jgi:hypothetical protein
VVSLWHVSRHGVKPRSVGRVAALVALTATSCAAKINRLSVLPHEACPDTPVLATWDVDGGRPSMTTEPKLDDQKGPTYRLARTTRFILTVRPFLGLGKSKSRDTQVTVFSGTKEAPQSDDLTFEAKCQGGQITAQFERPLDEWDPLILVGIVRSTEGRELTIRHANKEDVLKADHLSTAQFEGTPLAGSWSVSSPLQGGETCDGSGAPTPDILVLTADISCGGR